MKVAGRYISITNVIAFTVALSPTDFLVSVTKWPLDSAVIF